jgi:hypothetical protein
MAKGYNEGSSLILSSEGWEVSLSELEGRRRERGLKF